MLRARVLRVRVMSQNAEASSLLKLQRPLMPPMWQEDPAAFFSGDDALQAAAAAVACSIGILVIAALALVMLPVSIG